MVVDCKFDMVPFFTKGDSNDDWKQFLDEVLKEFKLGELKIIFQVVEFPILPCVGYTF